MPIEIWTMNEMTLQVSPEQMNRLYIAIKMATHRKFSNWEEEKCGAN